MDKIIGNVRYEHVNWWKEWQNHEDLTINIISLIIMINNILIKF